MKDKLYGFLWRRLIRQYACPSVPGGHIEFKGIGAVKHLSVIEGDLIIVVDGQGKLPDQP